MKHPTFSDFAKKKAIQIITFSDFRAHTSPLFKRLNLLKLPDIVYLNTALFMHASVQQWQSS